MAGSSISTPTWAGCATASERSTGATCRAGSRAGCWRPPPQAPLQRLRVLAVPDAGGLGVTIEADELRSEPDSVPVALAPVVLPGGLGEHKWIHRRLLARLEGRLGGVPLLVDHDGHVLEAAFANVWIAEGETLVTPPLHGRQRPGTVRAALLAAARDVFEVPRRRSRSSASPGAGEILLSSSIRGVYPGTLAGRRAARFEIGTRLVAELEERAAAAARARPSRRAVIR